MATAFAALTISFAAGVNQSAFAEDAVPGWVGHQYHFAQKPKDDPKVPEAKEGVRLARWQGDRAAAFSFIFDDGLVDQAAIAIPTLDQYGLRGTFALVTSRIHANAAEEARAATDQVGKPGKPPRAAAPWDVWKAALARGHELANHTRTHAASNEPEIQGGIDDLLANAGVTALTFVAPFNNYGKSDDFVHSKHLCWRDGTGLTYGKPPPDETPDVTAARWTARLEQLIPKGHWSLSMIHGISEGYDPTGEEPFRLHIGQAAKLTDRLWIAPAGEVARYDIAVRFAHLTVEFLPNGRRIRVAPGLPDPILAVPLTVVVDPGTPVTQAVVRRGESVIPSTVAGKKILFDTIPGSDWTEVTWK